jgi:hypothetical protein
MESVGAFVAGAIVGKLVLDKSKWSAAISEVKKDQSTLAGWGKSTSQGINLLGKAIVTTGLTAAFTLNKMVNRYVEAGEAIYEMSLRTGVATETLSEFSYVGDLCGVSTQELERSWKKMAATITDARRGNEGAIQTFRDMNLNFVDLIGLKPDEQFVKIGAALARMTDDTKESNAAQEVFGRTGVQLNTIFKEGPEVLARLREEAHKLGTVYTKDAAAGADRLADAKVSLKAAVTGLSMAIVERLIPAITSIVNTMTKTISGLKSKAGAMTEAILKIFFYIVKGIEGLMLAWGSFKVIVFSTAKLAIDALTAVMKVYDWAGEKVAKIMGVPWLSPVAGAIQTLDTISQGYNETASAEIDKMAGLVIGFDAFITKIKELTKAKKESAAVPVIPVKEALPVLPPGRDVSGIIAQTGKAWTAMTSAEQAALMQLSKDLTQEEMMLDTLDQAWQRAVGSITDSVTTLGATTGGVFGAMAGLVKGFIGEIITSLGKMVIAEQLATIKTVALAKVKAIAHAVSSIFSKLGFWGIPLAIAAVGLVTALFAKFAKFEKGGFVRETGPAIVHRGEYITPAAAAGGARVELVFAPVFNISTLDPMTTRDVVRERIGPELLDMLTAKILQPDFRKALGVRT